MQESNSILVCVDILETWFLVVHYCEVSTYSAVLSNMNSLIYFHVLVAFVWLKQFAYLLFYSHRPIMWLSSVYISKGGHVKLSGTKVDVGCFVKD